MTGILLLVCFLFYYVVQVESFRDTHLRTSISLNSRESFPTSLRDKLYSNKQEIEASNNAAQESKPSAFDMVASKGLAGVLAIAAAEAIFWALGMPLGNQFYKYINSYHYNKLIYMYIKATLWVKFTTGDWIDLMTTEGQLQAAGFTFGYGGFATAILQYRVTLFAIPLVPLMEKVVVQPGKKLFGEKFGEKKI